MPWNANGKYINRSLDWVEWDVKRQFKKVEDREDGFFVHYRDDQQIYKAWREMADMYKQQVLSASNLLIKKDQYIVDKNWKPILLKKWNEYWNAAAKFLNEAIKKFKNKYSNLKWIKITSSETNRRLIKEVAKDLNEAEDDVLKKIQDYCNPMQEWSNAVYHSSIKKDKKWNVSVKNGEIETQQPMYNQDKKWYITFTSRCNKLSFNNAVSWLYKHMKQKENNEYYWFSIDYSKCKSETLKKKMKNLLGSYIWDLYREGSKCFIKLSSWKVIDASKAWIYEWVMLRRKVVIRDESREAEKMRKEDLWKVNINENSWVHPEKDPELKGLVYELPEELKKYLRRLPVQQYRRFLINTERRLNEIAKEKVRYWYELHNPPVSDSLEINLIDGDTEHSVDFEASKTLWKNLWRIIKRKKSDYKDYLSSRLNSKRVEFWEVRLNHNLLEDLEFVEWYWKNEKHRKRSIDKDRVTDPDSLLNDEKLSSIYEWIDLLEQWFNALRVKEWNSHRSNEDKAYTSIVSLLKDLRYTISDYWKLTHEQNIRNIVRKVSEKIEYKYNDYRLNTWNKGFLKDRFSGILWYDKSMQQKIEMLRTIDVASFMNSWTTEFLGEKIVQNRSENWLKFKNSDIDKCFKNIDMYLSADDVDFDQDGNVINTGNIQNIKALYLCSNWYAIAFFLNKLWIIPNEMLSNKEIKKKCDDIYKNLRKRESQIAGVTMSSVKEWVLSSINKLESKQVRSRDEDEQLTKLKRVAQRSDLLIAYCKVAVNSSRDMIRYFWLNDFIAGSFVHEFVHYRWEWVISNSYNDAGYILNDVHWVWWFDLTDKNAAFLQDFAVDIVIWAILTLWIWAVFAGIWSACANLIKSSVKLKRWLVKIRHVCMLVSKAFWEVVTFVAEYSSFWAKVIEYVGKNWLKAYGETLKTACASAVRNLNLRELSFSAWVVSTIIAIVSGWIANRAGKLAEKLKTALENASKYGSKKISKLLSPSIIEKVTNKTVSKYLTETVGAEWEDFLFKAVEYDKELLELLIGESWWPMLPWWTTFTPFSIFWKMVDAYWNYVADRSTTVGDVTVAAASLDTFSKNNAPLYNRYKSSIQNGTYVVAFWNDKNIYLKDSRPWGKTVLISDLCVNKATLG